MTPMKTSPNGNLTNIVSIIAICTAVGAWAIVGYQAKDTTAQFRSHCTDQIKRDNDLTGTLSELKIEVKTIKEQNDRIEKILIRSR